jgi:hypothetical protein
LPVCLKRSSPPFSGVVAVANGGEIPAAPIAAVKTATRGRGVGNGCVNLHHWILPGWFLVCVSYIGSLLIWPPSSCCLACGDTVVPCSLVNIVDQLSNRRFLVDTRASYFISHTILLLLLLGQSLERQQVNPSHAGGKIFSPYPSIGGSSRGRFAGAVSAPIIGVDSPRHFKPMVDPAANALVDKCSSESFEMVSTLTAAGSADTGSPPVAQSSHWSTITSHRFTVTVQRSLVLSHRPSAARSSSGGDGCPGGGQCR